MVYLYTVESIFLRDGEHVYIYLGDCRDTALSARAALGRLGYY